MLGSRIHSMVRIMSFESLLVSQGLWKTGEAKEFGSGVGGMGGSGLGFKVFGFEFRL